MLICNRHGFLFVHIAGTGGASVRAALQSAEWSDPRRWARSLGQTLNRFLPTNSKLEITRHAPIIVARELLPPQSFFTLFKFSVVRNPWDRLVGAYSFCQAERQSLLAREHIDSFEAFATYVCSQTPTHAHHDPLIHAIARPQLESLIGLRGELLADFVGRFEQLPQDFQFVCTRVGLPKLKLATREPQDYRNCYCDKLAEQVGKYYADDLAAFQYAFDAPSAPKDAEIPSSFRVRAIAGKINS